MPSSNHWDRSLQGRPHVLSISPLVPEVTRRERHNEELEIKWPIQECLKVRKGLSNNCIFIVLWWHIILPLKCFHICCFRLIIQEPGAVLSDDFCVLNSNTGQTKWIWVKTKMQHFHCPSEFQDGAVQWVVVPGWGQAAPPGVHRWLLCC